MKKLCFIGIILALTPSLSFGDNFRVNKLIQEKQRKMAELEKCMGSTKGLKIAGISTLGLTAVGVVGNVAEAKKINEYDDKIESTEKSIEKTQKQIDETRADLAKQKAEAEEKKRKEELKKNCLQSRGTWKDEDYCECPGATKLNSYGRCELPANLVSTTVNGRNVLLNTTNNTYVDPTTGNVVGVVGGTVTGLSVGSTSGTDGGTSAGGTDGDAANQVDNTPDAPAGAVQCGVTCDSSYNNKTIACEGSDSNSKMDLYICKNNVWENKGSILNCNSDLTNPGSGYKKIGKWKTGFVFASNKTEISGASPKAWNISNYCEACESGKVLDGNQCRVNQKQCEVACDSKHNGKYMVCGKTGEQKVYKCQSGKWTKVTNIDTCSGGQIVVDSVMWSVDKNMYLFGTSDTVGIGDALWVTDPCVGCKKGYSKNSNDVCVQSKKTLIELVGSNISKGPSGWYARTNDGQCWLNNNSSDATGSCSSLTKNQWMAEFSWGYIRGTSKCDGRQCKCNLKLLKFSKNQEIHNFDSWYNHTNYQFPEHCPGGCAHGCSQSVIEDFRRKEAFEAYGTEL